MPCSLSGTSAIRSIPRCREDRTKLSLGSSTAGSLEADEEDQFVIEMSSSGTLVVYTTGSTDTYGSILDSSGNVLASNDDGGERLNFQISTP